MGDDRLPSFPALDPTAVPSRSWTLRPWRRLPKPNRKGKRDLPFPPFFRGEWLKFGSVPTHFISGFLFYQVERPPKMVCFLWRDLKSGYCWEATDYQKRTSQLSQMLNVWFIHSAIWGSLGGANVEKYTIRWVLGYVCILAGFLFIFTLLRSVQHIIARGSLGPGRIRSHSDFMWLHIKVVILNGPYTQMPLVQIGNHLQSCTFSIPFDIGRRIST